MEYKKNEFRLKKLSGRSRKQNYEFSRRLYTNWMTTNNFFSVFLCRFLSLYILISRNLLTVECQSVDWNGSPTGQNPSNVRLRATHDVRNNLFKGGSKNRNKPNRKRVTYKSEMVYLAPSVIQLSRGQGEFKLSTIPTVVSGYNDLNTVHLNTSTRLSPLPQGEAQVIETFNVGSHSTNSAISNVVHRKGVRVSDAHFAKLKNHHSSFMKLSAGTMPVEVKLSNLRDSQYVGPVLVGSQKIPVNVVFDTGSTNIWILSTLCEQDVCTHRRISHPNTHSNIGSIGPTSSGTSTYDPDKSISSVSLNPPVHLEIEFGTGSLSGPETMDTIHVGPYSITNQTFGMIEREDGEIFRQIPFEGILGLGFPSLAAEGDTPFFDNAMKQKVLQDKNQFSFYLEPLPGSRSTIFFGGDDPRFFEGEIRSVPVIQEHYWCVELEDFLIGDTSFAYIDTRGNDEKEGLEFGVDSESHIKVDKLIIDSGTTYYTAPPSIMARILDRLPGADCSDVFANEDKYPNITYVFKDKADAPFRISIPSYEYMIEQNSYADLDGMSSHCEPAFMAISVPGIYGPSFLLGEVFMRHWYTSFERGDGVSPSYVGFARSRRPEHPDVSSVTKKDVRKYR